MTDPTPSDASVVPAEAAAVPATVPAEPAARKSRGLGIFALVLGLGAFIGDLVLLGIAIAGAIGIFQSVTGGTFDFTSLFAGDFSTLLAGFAGFVFIAFIGFWVGIVVGALAMLLGIIAAVKNRGRAAGVFGAIFGLLVLISHLSVLATILGSADLLSTLNGLGT